MSLTALMIGLGAAAQATTIVQIGVVDAPVTQDIRVTGTSDPSFRDPSTGDAIFFEEWQRIATDEANIWDPSQVGTTPETASTNIVSQGLLSGLWTFDASVLDQDLTGFTHPDGTTIGTSSQISTLQVTNLAGEVVGGGVTSSSEVIVANNLLVGFEAPIDGPDTVPSEIETDGPFFGESVPVFLDVIAIAAGRSDNWDTQSDLDTPTEGASGGVVLLVSGGASWFEGAKASGMPLSFGDVLIGAVEYEEYVFGDYTGDGIGDTFLFDETINGDLVGGQIFHRNFGAADGSSESDPLLPTVDTVSTDEDGNPLPAPVFAFDVSEATPVDVDGIEIVFIDPEIATGYTYELTGAGAVAGILAPTLAAVNDADGYTVVLGDAAGTTFTIAAGEYVDFAALGVVGGVTSFTLTGIDPSLMLNPADGGTFVLGVNFAGLEKDSNFTQTAIVTEYDPVSAVPLPAGLPLMLAGAAVFGGLSMRRKRKS